MFSKNDQVNGVLHKPYDYEQERTDAYQYKQSLYREELEKQIATQQLVKQTKREETVRENQLLSDLTKTMHDQDLMELREKRDAREVWRKEMEQDRGDRKEWRKEMEQDRGDREEYRRTETEAREREEAEEKEWELAERKIHADRSKDGEEIHEDTKSNRSESDSDGVLQKPYDYEQERTDAFQDHLSHQSLYRGELERQIASQQAVKQTKHEETLRENQLLSDLTKTMHDEDLMALQEKRDAQISWMKELEQDRGDREQYRKTQREIQEREDAADRRWEMGERKIHADKVEDGEDMLDTTANRMFSSENEEDFESDEKQRAEKIRKDNWQYGEDLKKQIQENADRRQKEKERDRGDQGVWDFSRT